MTRIGIAALLLLGLLAPAVSRADLRLVPYPRQIAVRGQGPALVRSMRVTAPDTPTGRQAGRDVLDELHLLRVGGSVAIVPAPAAGRAWSLRLGDPTARGKAPLPSAFEGYRLATDPRGARVDARTEAGLLRGAATLCQLLRANVVNGRLPGVTIADYPAIRRRGFLDDITRGPSPTLATLRREARMAAYLRMNFLTYYLEHQYRHRKHPGIGPAGGSLLPEELSVLVADAGTRGVEVIGCQQSFGHFGHILSRSEYAHLRETPDVLDPTNEGVYGLLDDLYADQAPLTRSPLFNVCCDETWGLGTGPSRKVAERIGVGGVYAQHVTRLHSRLRERYGKRMMMWGDILLQHPDQIASIPRDTVMLSWGYHAAATFEPAILPFKKAGFTFFVCPGTSNWGMVLPLIDTSGVNIRNYVRDGARHGAAGVLTTTWNDDGETLFASNWYGLAWSAECAWNGSRTRLEDFDRRVGAVLLGERGDRFGRAIRHLARAQAHPGYAALTNARFWQPEAGRSVVTREAAAREARGLLTAVDPAIAELVALRREARVNRDVVDHWLFGARRVRLVAARTLARLEAAAIYERAQATADVARARAHLEGVRSRVDGARAAYEALRSEQRRLWLAEKRPYALDRVLARYDATIARHRGMAKALDAASAALGRGRPLPASSELGLHVPEVGRRRTVPTSVVDAPLVPSVQWAVDAAVLRVGIAVGPAAEDLADVPVEVDLPGLPDVPGGCVLVHLDADGGAQPVTCQLSDAAGKRTLRFMARGPLPRGAARSYHLYIGGPGGAMPGSGSTVRSEPRPGGALAIDNGTLGLLLGPEGAHVYRWNVAALGARDLTHPGESDWFGFGDVWGAHRNSRNTVEVVENGPALARVRCVDAAGLARTYDVWAGVPWVECRFDTMRDWFACYDDIALMGADTAAPGRYLFEDGETGPLRRIDSSTTCQTRRAGQRWCAKYVEGGAMIGLATPETSTQHVVGPGAGMGGVFQEGGPPTAHYVMYGGACPPDPGATMRVLRASLDFAAPLPVTLHAAQRRP